ncbi:gp19.5 family protein [Pseudomonas sp. HY7a-MNA-CIBAN-0227]|uniref:gp19.5 family protein n=1 Tax=Pseudomonas sp. HY7a-MNA-CIBAN-0227 TaxID=3140474 RepID=UPI00331D60D5
MIKMTTRWQTFAAVFKTLATHRATYRFLALLIVALGFASGGPLVEAFGSAVCVLVAGGCAE